MAQLKLIHKDFFTETYESYFENKPVRFIKNIFTGEIRISAEDTAKCLGFDNLNDMMGTDEALDAINAYKKEHPGTPVFGQYGSGAMFERTNFENNK